MRSTLCSAMVAGFTVVAMAGSAWAQAAAPAATSSATVAMAAAKPRFNLDTPIAVIAADPAAKAVLDKDMPGLTIHPMFESFKNLSLREFQPKTGGAITSDHMAATEKDLAALDASPNR